MNKILSIVLLCVGFVFAINFEKPETVTKTVKMQVLVGETAINNILNAYFAGTHEIPVKNMGNIKLIVNYIGIDIQNNNQGKADVVLGYKMTITSDFSSSISKISNGLIKGTLNINGALSTQEVKHAIDNGVEQTKNAIVILLDLNDAIERILNKYGVTETPVISAVKQFFTKTNDKITTTNDNIQKKIELWHQDYSTLLDYYVNKAQTVFDLAILSKSIKTSLENDNVVINFEATIQSEKQYFTIEGWPNDAENMHILSNKEFKILYMEYHIMAYTSMVNMPISCQNLPTESGLDFNITNLCKWNSNVVQPSLTTDFILRITVQTKHGGIITITKDRRQERIN